MFIERCNVYFNDFEVYYQKMFFVRNIFNDEVFINFTKMFRMGMLVQSIFFLFDFEIVLIGVKDDRFFFVEFFYYFNGQSINGGLEVRLFSINYYSYIFFDGIL